MALSMNTGLQATCEGEIVKWYFLYFKKKGQQKLHPLMSEGAPDEYFLNIDHLDRQEYLGYLCSNSIEETLIPLISLAQRPSYYGTSRCELEQLRTTNNIKALVALSPRNKKFTSHLGNTSDSEKLREFISDTLTNHPIGSWLVKSLTSKIESTKKMLISISLRIYYELRKDAWSYMYSDNMMIVKILRDRYKPRDSSSDLSIVPQFIISHTEMPETNKNVLTEIPLAIYRALRIEALSCGYTDNVMLVNILKDRYGSQDLIVGTRL